MEVIPFAPIGRYFFIRSRLNDLVLSLDKDNVNVMMGRHDRTCTAYQLWYEDHVTGTIRSKVNRFCLDVSGGRIQVQPYKRGSKDQNLFINGQTIGLRHNPDRVLDIFKESKDGGATLCLYNHMNQHNQHWTFEYAPPQYVSVSSMSSSEQLTAAPGEGASVVVRKAAPGEQLRDDQLWYEDRFGVLRSKLNNLALDSSSNGDVSLMPYNPCNKYQQFTIDGNTLINIHDRTLLLRIKPADQRHGSHLECGHARNSENERWMIKAV